MFRPLDDNPSNASEDLTHFTNRISETGAFQRCLKLPAHEPLPVMMFFGVGGTGKTWLLKHLRKSLPGDLASAYLDLDTNTGGGSFHTDRARALAEIRRQFGSSVRCPRFDLAYTWMRSKQGAGDEPLFKGNGLLGSAWELFLEVGQAAASDVPGANVLKWVIKKATAPVGAWLKTSGVADWLSSALGQKDFLQLKLADPGDIYSDLPRRLLLDLKTGLHTASTARCHGVIFLDTVECCHASSDSEERLLDAQRWIRNLYHPDSAVLLVRAGRDRLTWGDAGTDFSSRHHLEQHLIGGLSEKDARDFLGRCGVNTGAIQNAVLHVALDLEKPGSFHSRPNSGEISHIPLKGYHPFSLGLCVDTIAGYLSRGECVDAEFFDMAPGDVQELATRFLRSLGDNAVYASWLKKLSLTVRFDEYAARAALSAHPGAEQDAGWHTLLRYSFVRPADEPGWWTLHAKMRYALEAVQTKEAQLVGHAWWREHWAIRSKEPTDNLAGLAWLHHWRMDAAPALHHWTSLARQNRLACRTGVHYRLLFWWDSCDLAGEFRDSSRKLVAAAAATNLAIEYQNASGGNHSQMVRQAIVLCEAALRVHNECDFPQQWAGIQNNLGNAYAGLPTGNHDENLRKAIGCYKAALRVYTEQTYSSLSTGQRRENLAKAIGCYTAALRVRTESASPTEWATTQENLGNAYCDLPTGDRNENLEKAIACYMSTLRVRTETHLSQDWAATQNNLGNAYRHLMRGNRGEHLGKAIACFQAALRVYTETDFPRHWARTQNNLGVAYGELPTGDVDEDLTKAIACYEAALCIYTETDFPRDWAAVQNNLGACYGTLDAGDRTQNLAKAIASYHAALRVDTETASPQHWAGIQNNLGVAYAALPSDDSNDKPDKGNCLLSVCPPCSNGSNISSGLGRNTVQPW